MVWGLGFGVRGSGFGVWGLGCGVQGWGWYRAADAAVVHRDHVLLGLPHIDGLFAVNASRTSALGARPFSCRARTVAQQRIDC